MKILPAHPSLYQINTRVWLTELSRSLGRAATLDDSPDADLDRRVAGMGSYDRDGRDLASRRLYLDVPVWSHHVFEMASVCRSKSWHATPP